MKALVIGIGGASSSGKTTLSRLLRDIWPRCSILHEDDFYKPDEQIPFKNGVQDWDCLGSLDLVKLEETLTHIRKHGGIPGDLESKEDQNSVGECDVDAKVISSWTERARKGENNLPDGANIVIIDGFLLYSQQMEQIWSLFDTRLLTTISFNDMKKRRENRSGYVTLDGFWKDPPGYVENIVWPNYVQDHSFLFENGDVEGAVNDAACQKLQLCVMPKLAEHDMTLCLDWACKVVENTIRHIRAEHAR